MNPDQRFIRLAQYLQLCVGTILLLMMGALLLVMNPDWMTRLSEKQDHHDQSVPDAKNIPDGYWLPPDTTSIPKTPEGDLIRYGRELVARTAVYLGPEGKVMQITNGMNCQNCHLKAGKKIFGNNYSAVASTYPKFRARSGSNETIEKRVNDCIERSLNGKALPHNRPELNAFIAYISWVGKDVKKNLSPPGAGLWELPLMDRPADPIRGKEVFIKHCILCHGENGKGIKAENGLEWKYPPLCGDGSYNTGAGLFRLSRFAGYVKANMPNGATFENPILTDEEAWDVAAYVNSLPRPDKKFPDDWPDISKKPYDHPFGPYADTFSEAQHKYGPFAAIKNLSKK